MRSACQPMEAYPLVSRHTPLGRTIWQQGIGFGAIRGSLSVLSQLSQTRISLTPWLYLLS